jgi:hypothetical protein
MRYIFFIAAVLSLQANCKRNSTPPPAPAIKNPAVKNILLNNNSFDNTLYGTPTQPVIAVSFSEPVMQNTVAPAVKLTDAAGTDIVITISFQNKDSAFIVQPSSPLNYLSKYNFKMAATLKSTSGGSLNTAVDKTFITRIDSAGKFPVISDNALLDLVQQQTFKYFWDFGHPVSGLARERSNSTPETITSGGSGFGIMAIPVGINRNFITRAQGLARMQTIVSFLKNTAQKFHGAFPHWLNGTTGVVIPFSPKDNGADLVETSYLMAGLLTVRQFFNGADAAETTLRNDITALYNNVEWDWFRNGGQNVLYWHWSSNFNWEMNFPIRGWNECLITYVLAASSTTHGIPASVYTNGWANNGNSPFKNGNSYYGYQLPLGENSGGPLFFSHYSFLGINPNGLSDAYANYQTQTKNHTLINYEYCKANPKNHFGYSDSCWGLTASDIKNDYTASSPTNDVSFIAPTAALSSFPYTPVESMKALKFFYYVLGDKIFKEYGFVDAFSLKELWYANSFLAIDQGPIIVMIENYRSGLLWNLFTSCPEVKIGMKNILGFAAPYL